MFWVICVSCFNSSWEKLWKGLIHWGGINAWNKYWWAFQFTVLYIEFSCLYSFSSVMYFNINHKTTVKFLIYREYPCDSVAMLNLSLLYCGCPRIHIREMASQLLVKLCKRFLLIDETVLPASSHANNVQVMTVFTSYRGISLHWVKIILMCKQAT